MAITRLGRQGCYPESGDRPGVQRAMIHWPTRSNRQEPREPRATTPAFSRLLHAAIDAPAGSRRRKRKRETPQQPQNA